MMLLQFYKRCPITFCLLVAIIGMFVFMVLSGVHIETPHSNDLLRFGGNFFAASMFGEPHRLIVSGFIHAGIIHLLFNSFALYFFGQAVEQLFGRLAIFCIFMLAVIGGNLTNLIYSWYTFSQAEQLTSILGVSVGASGGIMGLGASLVVLSLSRHPLAKTLDKKNLLLVMGANLLLGFFISGIDNAGHIGGTLTGLILGIYLSFKSNIKSNAKPSNHQNAPTVHKSIYWDIAVYTCVLFVFIGAFCVLEHAVMSYSPF